MAFDATIHIDTIEGSSADFEFTGEIEVLQFNYSVCQPPTATASTSGNMAAERADWTPFTFTKYVDKASPVLMQYCATGTHVSTVEFWVRRAGTEQQPFHHIILGNCIISSVDTGGSAGADFPSETVTIRFGKFMQEYTETNREDGQTQGATVFKYDLQTNSEG